MPEPKLLDESLAGFLTRLAAHEPTPGGGSVAALTGALAAALTQMVVSYTVGKPKFAAVEAEVAELGRRAARAETLLRELVDEDAAAYGVLSAAFKLERTDPTRPDHIANTAALAAQVPLQTAVISGRLLADVRRLSEIGNPQLRADSNAAEQLARAAIHAAAGNVQANTPLMRKDEAAAVEAELTRVLATLD